MDIKMKNRFLDSWVKYFNGAELPIVFFYSDTPSGAETVKPAVDWSCLIADLNKARNGKTLCLDKDSVGCFGGKRYLGFTTQIREGFEYFLSTGVPGIMAGERYKKTPEIVKKIMDVQPGFEAPAKYAIFKRWDKLDDNDEPEAVIFYARPDVLSGLFTLAGFDVDDPAAVITPFSAGCGSIAMYPYIENQKEKQKCILGMFDVSARPCVPPDILTFSVPMKKFTSMVKNMEESFLITRSWEKIRKRIAKSKNQQ